MPETAQLITTAVLAELDSSAAALAGFPKERAHAAAEAAAATFLAARSPEGAAHAYAEEYVLWLSRHLGVETHLRRLAERIAAALAQLPLAVNTNG